MKTGTGSSFPTPEGEKGHTVGLSWPGDTRWGKNTASWGSSIAEQSLSDLATQGRRLRHNAATMNTVGFWGLLGVHGQHWYCHGAGVIHPDTGTVWVRCFPAAVT